MYRIVTDYIGYQGGKAPSKSLLPHELTLAQGFLTLEVLWAASCVPVLNNVDFKSFIAKRAGKYGNLISRDKYIMLLDNYFRSAIQLPFLSELTSAKSIPLPALGLV